MTSSYNVLSQIIREGLKADRERRTKATKALMDEGLPWNHAYRQVNWPYKTQEEFDALTAEYEKAFNTKETKGSVR